MFVTIAVLFFTICSAGHTITYMTACCWNNFALSTTEKLFKIKTDKPIWFKRICNSFKFLKTEIVLHNDQENSLKSREKHMDNKMNIAILQRQKKYVLDSCSIYIQNILFLLKALSGISWNKIPNSWFKLSPSILRKNEEKYLKHSEGNLPKLLTNKEFSYNTQ